MGLGRCVVTHIICTIMQKKNFMHCGLMSCSNLTVVGVEPHTTVTACVQRIKLVVLFYISKKRQ